MWMGQPQVQEGDKTVSIGWSTMKRGFNRMFGTEYYNPFKPGPGYESGRMSKAPENYNPWTPDPSYEGGRMSKMPEGYILYPKGTERKWNTPYRKDLTKIYYPERYESASQDKGVTMSNMSLAGRDDMDDIAHAAYDVYQNNEQAKIDLWEEKVYKEPTTDDLLLFKADFKDYGQPSVGNPFIKQALTGQVVGTDVGNRAF